MWEPNRREATAGGKVTFPMVRTLLPLMSATLFWLNSAASAAELLILQSSGNPVDLEKLPPATL